VLAVLALSLFACNSDSPFEVIESVEFDPGLGIDLTQMTKLPSGVYIQDIVVGTGAVVAVGHHVSLQMTGWIRDGTQWSSGLLTFDYGVTDLGVDGFDIGIEGMAVGGTRLIIVPPELGYGEFPPPGSVIPKGAILIYEVDLYVSG
jgi:FKBP-type peptidyl-prolyl cis-trans isomerase